MRFQMPRRIPFRCLVLAAVLVPAAAPAHATQDPQKAAVRDVPAAFLQPYQGKFQNLTLADYLHNLWKTHKINFMVDGVPGRRTVDLNLAGTIVDALDTIGKAFDCDWKLNAHGVVAFARQLQRPGEMPQLHTDELTRMAKDILGYMHTVTPPHEQTVFPNYAAPFVASLTPQQTTALKTGNRLRATDVLNAEQCGMAARIVATGHFDRGARGWEQALARLRVLPRGRLEIRRIGRDPQGREYCRLSFVTREANGRIQTDDIYTLSFDAGESSGGQGQ